MEKNFTIYERNKTHTLFQQSSLDLSFTKYLKYKTKYTNLQNQLGGDFKNINSIYFRKFKKYESNEYDLTLLNLLRDKLDKNKNNCDKFQSNLEVCKTLNKYHPLPTQNKDFSIYNQIINGTTKKLEGGFGEIFTFKIDEKDVILKIPNKPNKEMINEAFVNYCIINDYIISNTDHNLVFTYGLFFCKIKRDDKKIIEICDITKDSDDYPNIHLIQEFIKDAKTLEDIIRDDHTFNLEKLKIYISQIFNQLKILEEGVFNLTHNDLKSNNIMIKKYKDKDKAYIIDWGEADFKIGGKRYMNQWHKQNPSKYNKNSIVYDLFLFICSTRLNIQDKLILLNDKDKILTSDEISNKNNLILILDYLNNILDEHFFKKIFIQSIDVSIFGLKLEGESSTAFQIREQLKHIEKTLTIRQLKNIPFYTIDNPKKDPVAFNIYVILNKNNNLNINMKFLQSFTYSIALKILLE